MERKRVNSSKLRAIGYDERSQLLEIEFPNGTVVQYSGVSREVHRGLMAAPNPGSYFEDRIAEEYSSKRV